MKEVVTGWSFQTKSVCVTAFACELGYVGLKGVAIVGYCRHDKAHFVI